MNDLDVLESVQRFRADVPEPDRDHVRDARRAFHTALAEANARPARPRSRPWNSWKVRVPVMAGAAATLAAALAIGVVGIPGGGPTVNPAAAATLNAAADAVADEPTVPSLQEGQFFYVKTSDWQPASDAGPDAGPDRYQPELRGTSERWLGLDGTLRIVSEAGEPFVPTDETFRGEPLRLGTNVGGTLEEIAALPRDTQQLYSLVEQVTRDMDNDRPVNVQMFVLVRDLLREPLLPLDLRESLYRVAARIPGVQVTEGVTDQLGRTGIAIWMVEGDTDLREEFIIDPGTGNPLAERSLAQDGSVVYESAIIEWGIVDSIDARP